MSKEQRDALNARKGSVRVMVLGYDTFWTYNAMSARQALARCAAEHGRPASHLEQLVVVGPSGRTAYLHHCVETYACRTDL